MADNESKPVVAASHDAIFREVVETQPPGRKRRNLEIVWQALQALESEGVKEFTVARVGQRSDELGGPKAQSIRNKGGAHFRYLIERFAAGAGGAAKKVPLRQPSQVEMAIAQIPDLGVQVVIKMALEESRRLGIENNNLRNAYKALSIRETPCDATPTETSAPFESSQHTTFNDLMLDSFERFLSGEWMEERGLRLEPDGSIIDTTAGGMLVAPPGFGDGLQCAIKIFRTQKTTEIL